MFIIFIVYSIIYIKGTRVLHVMLVVLWDEYWMIFVFFFFVIVNLC